MSEKAETILLRRINSIEIRLRHGNVTTFKDYRRLIRLEMELLNTLHRWQLQDAAHTRSPIDCRSCVYNQHAICRHPSLADKPERLVRLNWELPLGLDHPDWCPLSVTPKSGSEETRSS